jgi:hypothetical protein
VTCVGAKCCVAFVSMWLMGCKDVPGHHHQCVHSYAGPATGGVLSRVLAACYCEWPTTCNRACATPQHHQPCVGLSPTHPILLLLQVTNPLYLWQFWRSDAHHARQCFARHDSMMNDKVAALLKLPPPEYTIAGTLPWVCAFCYKPASLWIIVYWCNGKLMSQVHTTP